MLQRDLPQPFFLIITHNGILSNSRRERLKTVVCFGIMLKKTVLSV